MGRNLSLVQGKMRSVPKYALPEEEWSDELRLAQQIFGTPARLAITVFLKTHGASLTATLIEELGLDSTLVKRNLDQLEAIGVVIGDPAPGKRVGRSTRWTINEQMYTELMLALMTFTGIAPSDLQHHVDQQHATD